MIRRLILHDGSLNTQKDGIYRIKLFINGLPISITLDDYIPINIETGMFAFLATKDGSLWVSLLHKAFAKIYGGFNKLNLSSH